MLATVLSKPSKQSRSNAGRLGTELGLHQAGGGNHLTIMEGCAGQGGKPVSFPDQNLPSLPEKHGEIPNVSGNSGVW